MTSSRIAASIALSLIIPNIGFAQRTAQLEQGARVRVRTAGRSTVGTVQALSRDSLALVDQRSAEVSSTSFDRVSRIDVSKGRSHLRGAGLGALFGATTGILVGSLVGAATYSGECDVLVCSRGSAAGLLGAISGTAGLVIGTLAGAAIGRESWETIDKTRYRAVR